MAFRGEYWWQDGYLTSADGDVSHEGHAWDAALRRAADLAEDFINPYEYTDSEFVYADELQKGIIEGINRVTHESFKPFEDLSDALAFVVSSGKMSEQNAFFIHDALTDRRDWRLWAIKELDWIWMSHGNIGVQEVNAETFDNIACAVLEAREMHGDADDDDDADGDDEPTVFVRAAKNDKTFEFSLSDLRDGKLVGQRVIPKHGIAQIDRLDRDIENPHYRGKHGE